MPVPLMPVVLRAGPPIAVGPEPLRTIAVPLIPTRCGAAGATAAGEYTGALCRSTGLAASPGAPPTTAADGIVTAGAGVGAAWLALIVRAGAGSISPTEFLAGISARGWSDGDRRFAPLCGVGKASPSPRPHICWPGGAPASPPLAAGCPPPRAPAPPRPPPRRAPPPVEGPSA